MSYRSFRPSPSLKVSLFEGSTTASSGNFTISDTHGKPTQGTVAEHTGEGKPKMAGVVGHLDDTLEIRRSYVSGDAVCVEFDAGRPGFEDKQTVEIWVTEENARALAFLFKRAGEILKGKHEVDHGGFENREKFETWADWHGLPWTK